MAATRPEQKYSVDYHEAEVRKAGSECDMSQTELRLNELIYDNTIFDREIYPIISVITAKYIIFSNFPLKTIVSAIFNILTSFEI